MCLTRRKALPWTCHSKGVVMLLKSITVHSRVSSCAKSFIKTIRLDQDTAREFANCKSWTLDIVRILAIAALCH